MARDTLSPGRAAVQIRRLTDTDALKWDAFVLAHPSGTFYHRAGWKTIFESIFKFESHYLLAERGSEIVGILPLALQRSMLFGTALLSSPFCMEGGPISLDEEADNALVDAALALQRDTKSPYIEFRSRKATHNWIAKTDLYATFARALSSDDQQNLQAIPRKQRAVVRKTLESGLISEIDEDLGETFRVYAESVRNLGTPVFPKSYFPALKRVFGNDCDALVVKDKGVPVSAVLNFYHRDTVLPHYGGGTASARRSGANDFLYWEVMRRSAAKGYRRYEFGRSKAGTGAFAFKKNWGFTPEWLEYEYYVGPGHALPDKNPLNPKYSLMIETWKRLPLPVANFLGPFLIRGLG